MVRRAINPQTYNRIYKCIAATIRIHPANTSGDGLCPQLIISSYSYRHWIWSSGAADAPTPNEFEEKEGFIRSVIEQMIHEKKLIEVSRVEKLPATIGVPAKEEQCYVLDSSCDAGFCELGELCDDLLHPGAFYSSQTFSNSTISNIAANGDGSLSMSNGKSGDTVPDSSVVSGNTLSTNDMRAKKRRRKNPEADATNTSSGASTAADKEKLTQELAKYPWLPQGLEELSRKFPDDRYEAVFEHDSLQIRCHDCTHRLYKIHYVNRDVSNVEYHAKATGHAARVEKRLSEAGAQPTMTPEVAARQKALEELRLNGPKRRNRRSGWWSPDRPSSEVPYPIAPYPPLQPQLHDTFQVTPTTNINPASQDTNIVISNARANTQGPANMQPALVSTANGTTQASFTSESDQSRHLESRITRLEQEAIDQKRTIDTMFIKIRSQQQVENTHQSVIRDLVQRVQNLEDRDRHKESEIFNLQTQTSQLQTKTESLRKEDGESEKIVQRIAELQNNFDMSAATHLMGSSTNLGQSGGSSMGNGNGNRNLQVNTGHLGAASMMGNANGNGNLPALAPAPTSSNGNGNGNGNLQANTGHLGAPSMMGNANGTKNLQALAPASGNGNGNLQALAPAAASSNGEPRRGRGRRPRKPFHH